MPKKDFEKEEAQNLWDQLHENLQAVKIAIDKVEAIEEHSDYESVLPALTELNTTRETMILMTGWMGEVEIPDDLPIDESLRPLLPKGTI